MGYFRKSEEQRLLAVLYNTSFFEKAPAGFPVMSLDGSARERAIRQGDFLAFVGTGADKKIIAAKETELRVALPAGATTTVQVKDAHPFKVGDTVRTAVNANSAVISAVNYETNTITIPSTDLDGAINDRLYTPGKNDPIGIALLPMMDEYAHDELVKGANQVLPEGNPMYGDIGLTGLYRIARLKNFRHGGYFWTVLIGPTASNRRAGRAEHFDPSGPVAGTDPEGILAITAPSPFFYTV